MYVVYFEMSYFSRVVIFMLCGAYFVYVVILCGLKLFSGILPLCALYFWFTDRIFFWRWYFWVFFQCAGPIFETEFLFCEAKGYFFPGKKLTFFTFGEKLIEWVKSVIVFYFIGCNFAATWDRGSEWVLNFSWKTTHILLEMKLITLKCKNTFFSMEAVAQPNEWLLNFSWEENIFLFTKFSQTYERVRWNFPGCKSSLKDIRANYSK